MTSRKDIEKFFEDYFAEKLNLKFDENLKIKDINGFDSLEVVSLSLDFEDKFSWLPLAPHPHIHFEPNETPQINYKLDH